MLSIDLLPQNSGFKELLLLGSFLSFSLFFVLNVLVLCSDFLEISESAKFRIMESSTLNKCLPSSINVSFNLELSFESDVPGNFCLVDVA